MWSGLGRSDLSRYPKIQLSKLREIGWTLWDPIGLANSVDQKDEGQADEYDTYLIHVVSLLSQGKSKQAATDYLKTIEAEYIGLGKQSDSDLRGSQTVAAIADYLGTLPDGPKTIR